MAEIDIIGDPEEFFRMLADKVREAKCEAWEDGWCEGFWDKEGDSYHKNPYKY